MNNNSKNINLPIFREEDILLVNWIEVKNIYKLDFLVGFVHWDFEQSYIPKHVQEFSKKFLTNFQETSELAHKLVLEQGFDAIVGHGPHVLQTIEIFQVGNFSGNQKINR